MKQWFCCGVLICLFWNRDILAQEIPAAQQQQLENLAMEQDTETEDDAWWQSLSDFRTHPMDINTAAAEELRQLKLVNDLQIEQLIRYRRLLGKLLAVEELQAVPGWDVATIRKLMPFIRVSAVETVSQDLRRRLKEGEHSVLFRVSQVLERAKGFDPSYMGNRYLGSPQRILLRYRYAYRNLLQYGVLGEKDAGERFFKGAQRMGFDFYSFHVFVRNLGRWRALALGDFTVNMGQGLIHWQGLAFKKSVEVMGVKRQSTVFRPYHSAGEFYFHRGMGATYSKGKITASVFVSLRRLSANGVADSLGGVDVVSSLLSGGYHRTLLETEDRNRLQQRTAGAVISYEGNGWRAGINGVYYQFSLPIRKREEPYNLYAIRGNSWYNYSADFSYTFRNLHFFGEAAADRNAQPAMLAGLLMSAAARVDLAFLYRNISPGYQSLYGNAFTDNALPVNERGLFAGLRLRPFQGWQLDAYTDLYLFPWLKYQVDAPGGGMDYLIQLEYAPSRQVEWVTRYRTVSRQGNARENAGVMHSRVWFRNKSWRTQLNWKLNREWEIRARTEMSWYREQGRREEEGFLMYYDLLYHPMMRPYSGGIRLQYFDTDGYDSRIYAYENDVPYQYAIPGFYDRGYRFYLNLGYDLTRKLSCWFRWAGTFYTEKRVLGSGLDQIQGSKRTEIRVQMRYFF